MPINFTGHLRVWRGSSGCRATGVLTAEHVSVSLDSIFKVFCVVPVHFETGITLHSPSDGDIKKVGATSETGVSLHSPSDSDIKKGC